MWHRIYSEKLLRENTFAGLQQSVKVFSIIGHIMYSYGARKLSTHTMLDLIECIDES